jgi:asparagine synthase (glutamine-hydrolysing)
MCGITGKLYFDRQRDVSFTEIKRMTDVIHHRGPDDEGFYIQKNVGLGFRRLSIIDLKTGHQPLSNHDDSIYIVFNGEIYNYRYHRELLIKKGYVFKTTTDTEVILHLYEEYGLECLQYLRGMFAFAIWDNNKQQLFCARDRFGIKPFYYYADDRKFVFGSEIKSILKEGDIDKTLCGEALNSFFAFGYITSDKAIYEKIKKLQPGHYLLVSFKNEAEIHIEKYWHIEFELDYSKSEKQWVEEIDATLLETVRLHMVSDVPLGAFLSGGIDSSSVVAAMAKNSDRPIETFSMGFKQEKYSELKHARQIAKKYHCNHHEEIVDPESISLLPKLVRAYDEPFADPSVIPTYYVSKFAREHVTVALSGDGGDELFAGYNIYPYLQRIYRYNLTPFVVNKAVWGNVNKLIPQAMRGKTLTYFLSQNRNYLGAHLCIWPKDERKKLIRSDGNLRYTNAPEIFKERLLAKRSKNDFLTNHLRLDMETYMVDDILTKVDRASMMNSLEVRVPLLDHKFAELTFRIPSNLKLKGTEQKYIFKQAIKNALPEIVNRPKTGFGVPLSLWFKEGLKEYVNDTLFVSKPLLSDHLDWNYIKSMTKKDKDGMEKFSARIWSLLWFEEWLKQRKEA